MSSVRWFTDVDAPIPPIFLEMLERIAADHDMTVREWLIDAGCPACLERELRDLLAARIAAEATPIFDSLLEGTA